MNKIRLGFFSILMLIFLQLAGQTVAPSKYFIQFTDKQNSPFSLSDPEAYLSARALARRAAHGISLQQNDLPVNPQYIRAVASKGVRVLEASKWLNGVVIYTTDTALVDSVENLPFVKRTVRFKQGIAKAKPFFKNESFSKVPPEMPMKATTFSEADYGFALTQIKQLNGIPLHNQGHLGQGMVIAVLDGGFVDVGYQPVFDSLRARNGILGTKNFVNPGSSVYTQSDHGRMVLSCMAADEPGLMIGTAPDASYWLLLSEDVTSENVIEEYNWVCAAEFADSAGADIINSSLGYTAFDDTSASHPYSDLNGRTAISTIGAEIAASKGILVVNSAGNSGGDPAFPWVGAPADGDSVFTIGAVDAYGNRAFFSSVGPTYDGRIKPTVMAMGEGATVADGSNGVLYGNGTSFSSPIIAGMCACLWQAHPNVSNVQIMAALKETASDHSDPNNLMGWGIPDFSRADSLLTALYPLSIGSHPESSRISLAPNPFRNSIRIRLWNVSGSLDLVIYDLAGQRVFHRTFSSGTEEIILSGTDLNPIPEGLYLMKLRSSRQVFIKKLVKY